MKIYIFIITSLMISCADMFYEKEDHIEENHIDEESIVGCWFACEFGYSEPDCIIFDDDGLQFTNDGKVYYIQEFTQMSSDDCNRGPCFNNSLDTVIVERFYVGNYTYSNSNIFLTDSLNNSCNERITWNTDNSLFIGNYCLGSEEPYMKKYVGEVLIE